MRWLKHLSCAHRDEKITELISECGLEGYGFFWLLCEVVAESMDKTDRCDLTHPLPQWSHLLYSHHHRVSKYLGKLQVIGLCEVSNGDGNIRVAIPNLLKYRDEYASRVGTKSGQDRDIVPSKIEKQKHNTQTEEEQKKNAASAAAPIPPRKEPSAMDLQIQAASAELSKEHPRQDRTMTEADTERALRGVLKTVPAIERVFLLETVVRRHRGRRNGEGWQDNDGQFCPKLKNWLNAKNGDWKLEPVERLKRIPRTPSLFACQKCNGSGIILPEQPEGMPDEEWLEMGRPCECTQKKAIGA